MTNAADTENVVPLTPPGPLWSQREYVECSRLKIGFAAHRDGALGQLFHYHFPGVGCSSAVVRGDEVFDVLYHDFEPTTDWINQCRGAVGGAYKQG